MSGSSKVWIPEGHHWYLHCTHDHRAGNGAGPFTGGGWKGVIHITVSRWTAIDVMAGVLHAKSAEPQLLIGGKVGVKDPFLTQMMGLDCAGKALKHAPGSPETNRANAVQMEICATVGSVRRELTDEEAGSLALFEIPDLGEELFLRLADAQGVNPDLEPVEICMPALNSTARMLSTTHQEAISRAYNSGVAAWTDQTYKALGNAWGLVTHGKNPRVPIPDRVPRAFSNGKRFTPAGFVRVSGYVGHRHSPSPDDHDDPTKDFRGDKLLKFTKSAPNPL